MRAKRSTTKRWVFKTSENYMSQPNRRVQTSIRNDVLQTSPIRSTLKTGQTYRQLRPLFYLSQGSKLPQKTLHNTSPHKWSRRKQLVLCQTRSVGRMAPRLIRTTRVTLTYPKSFILLLRMVKGDST